MAGYVDLHLHTAYSDGALSPDDLLAIVREKKLVAFSITDHDTLEGYRHARKLLTKDDPELITGIELSAESGGEDMHLLGYLFDPDDKALNASIVESQEIRRERGRIMVEKLNQMGMQISFEAVEQAAQGSVVGRPHVADVLLEEGHISNFDEAFRKYIGYGCEAYVPRRRLTPAQAIDLIHGAGGVAVLAHAFIAGMNRHIEALAGQGLDGLEVQHYAHKKHHVKQLKTLAKRYGLLHTGGSDFHGRRDHEGEVGSLNVPVGLLDSLKQHALQIRGTQ
ncbi:MAG: PHP domain-containing protein [bacterium]|nr:PHP domain-containing protein [bacterium]